LVLDTSAFVAGFDPFLAGGEQYTVPLVKDEILGKSMPAVRFDAALHSGNVKVKVPHSEFLDKARAYATQVGDTSFLSETDHQVLALALELKSQGCSPLIVTDDYSMQNVANQMNIEFASLATFGIRRRLQWVRYCPACHKKYHADHKAKICEVCGTNLKRKPLRKDNLNHRT
jgi:rRNA maturation endonuclease Nob1